MVLKPGTEATFVNSVEIVIEVLQRRIQVSENCFNKICSCKPTDQATYVDGLQLETIGSVSCLNVVNELLYCTTVCVSAAF